MRLKYQSEIDKLELKNCPSDVNHPNENITVYRFSYEPIDHEHNFLPNVLIDKIKNAPVRNTDDESAKCLRCGASLFITTDDAIDKWKKLPIQFKENYGYTHLAQGYITKEDGLISVPKKGHLTFYENEKTKLVEQFKLISKL